MMGYGRFATAGGLFLISSAAFADGSIGVDYLSSEVSIVGYQGTRTQIGSAGPGISLAWGLDENWTISLSHSSIETDGSKESSTDSRISVGVESESSSSGLGMSYYGDNYWVGLRYRQSEDDQKVRGFSRNNAALRIDIDQVQEAQSLTFEVGRDWLLGNWSPALSVSIGQQALDIERTERVDTLNLSTIQGVQEDLSGVDLGISASISYYFQLSDNVFLAPNLGVFHQLNLSGDVSGLASFSQSRRNRSFQASQDYREKLKTPEDTSVDFGINLLAGNWLFGLGSLTSLTERRGEDRSTSWFAGLSYSF